jgi:YVTN family beta-propeller protein
VLHSSLALATTLGLASVVLVAALAAPGGQVPVRQREDRGVSPRVTPTATPAPPDPRPAASDRAPAGPDGWPAALGRQIAELVAVADDALRGLLAGDAGAVEVDEAAAETAAADDQSAETRKRERGSSRPADKRRLHLVRTISGGMAPKSIVSDQRGRVYAMNMMYGHSITVFDRHYKRVKDISDTIDLSRYGHRDYPEPVQGAPAEAAVSPDGRKIYVSNYSMYGPGFKHPGFDLCKASDRIDRSFVYEIGTRSLRKTAAIEVGEVPKYLAISPNGRTMLVGNWCSWDISVVDLRQRREVARIPAGVAPRGIAFSPNGRTAYVTLVGEDRILVIDVRSRRVVRDIRGVGERPRHLVMSPGGRFLYITSEGKDKPHREDGSIIKYDTRRQQIVARSKPLVEPRTTVISDDGRALYVVDYHPGTIVKLATDDLSELQDRYLGFHPIGVTYDVASDKIWVAGYGGQVWVLKDR